MPLPDRKHAEPRAPIPSSTVMVIRDGVDGLEIFMLVRNRQVDFASGALVFPGGKNDTQDGDAAWDVLAPVSAQHPPRPYWVSALRETFEETGLLLAERVGNNEEITAADAARITKDAQLAIARGERTFADLIATEGLRLATNRLVPFAHWITPPTMPKRFDTHFFLAAAPAGQLAIHDGGETVESMWITPRQAVADAAAGKRVLVPATQLNLEKLAAAHDVARAFERARQDTIVSVTPSVAKTDGGVTVTIPAGAGYATTSVFVPRPSPA